MGRFQRASFNPYSSSGRTQDLPRGGWTSLQPATGASVSGSEQSQEDGTDGPAIGNSGRDGKVMGTFKDKRSKAM